MTTKVNGFVSLGEFLTGNIDFFIITTLVPCDSNGVSKPIELLKRELNLKQTDNISVIGGVTIFGTTYSNDNDYVDAFNKQQNLDNFIKFVEQRAQAIMLNVTTDGAVGDVSAEIPVGGHAADFGSVYSGNPGTVYIIKFATEHEGAWDQTSLPTELDGREVLDLTTPVISDPNVFDTSSVTLRNTIVLRNNFL